MGKIVVASEIAEAQSIHWCSPLWITNGVHRVFNANFQNRGLGINLDPCSNPGAAKRVKAIKNLLPQDCDSLKADWRLPDGASGQTMQNAYVNPPFGRYYIHPTTKDFMSTKQVKDRVAALVKVGVDKTVARERVLNGYEAHSIREWVQRCSDEAQYKGMDVIQLGPASVGSAWWQDIPEKTARSILYIRGRLVFDMVVVDPATDEPMVISQGDPAPMDCALTLWTNDEYVLNAFHAEFESRGAIHDLEGAP